MMGKKLGIFVIIGMILLALAGVAAADSVPAPKVMTHNFSESAILGGRTLAPSFDWMLVTPMSIGKVKLGENYWPIKIKVMSPTGFHIDMMTNARDGLKDATTGFTFQNQATVIVNGVDVPINTGGSWVPVISQVYPTAGDAESAGYETFIVCVHQKVTPDDLNAIGTSRPTIALSFTGAQY